MPSQAFWDKERAARLARFGQLSHELFEQQAALAADDVVTVDIVVHADVPEPQLPYDGTDKSIPIEEFRSWMAAHANAQVGRITAAKARVLSVLGQHGAVIGANPRALPSIRAQVSAELLRSTELNAPDVNAIYPVEEPSPKPALLGYAGRASMASLGPNADNPPSTYRAGLTGGQCGGPCDGGLIDVGLLETSETPVEGFSGIARNNARLVGANTQVTGYIHCPKSCSTDADCPNTDELARSCRAPAAGQPRICVQDHLSWVAASVGMVGSYDYQSRVPSYHPTTPFDGPCTTNADCGTGHVCVFAVSNKQCVRVFPSTGAYRVDFRVANDFDFDTSLDFLVWQGPEVPSEPCQVASAPATHYINRSATGSTHNVDFVARAYGTFVAFGSGNDAGSNVNCPDTNILCVGSFDYTGASAYDDMAGHGRTFSSSFVNRFVDVERPHLLAPGNAAGNTDGLHMPSIDVDPGSSEMRTRDYSLSPGPIRGTSFSSPAAVSAAIQAHQFEGWFSALAYPMVDKAVLLASTHDANGDGAVGKGNTWSANAPAVDAQDGAGQIRFDRLQTILANNTYFWDDLSDTDFVSCGTGCRKVTVATVTVPAQTQFRVAMAWQACTESKLDVPQLNNDLNLALNCGSPLIACGGTLQSNTAASEVEMLEKPRCTYSRSCAIEIRIQNGASLAACGSTTTERVGVAWSFGN